MKYFIQTFVASDGKPARGPEWRDEITGDLLARIKAQAEDFTGQEVVIYVCEASEAPVQQGGAWERLVATIVDGLVAGVAESPEMVIWLHTTIVDGGVVNQSTGTRYVQRGETLTYMADFRSTSDPAGDVLAVIPGTGIPLTDSWAIEFSHEYDRGAIWSPVVSIVNGHASGVLVVPDRLADGLYYLDESRMAQVGPFTVKVANPENCRVKVVS